jgi:hypothetical protein
VCLFGFGDEWVDCGDRTNTAATPAGGPDASYALKGSSECRAWRVADIVAAVMRIRVAGVVVGEVRIPPRVDQSACGARQRFMV